MTASSETLRMGRRPFVMLGAALGALALTLHVLAARTIGGSYIAYRDHLAGFAVIALISGLLIGILGTRVWPRRRDIAWLTFGLLQAAVGVLAYVTRFHVHG